jgi:hypothetical protein
VKVFEILESDARVACLASRLNMLVAFLGSFSQKYIEVWEPFVFIIKFGICVVFHASRCTVFHEDRPKHIPGTQERSLVNDVIGRLDRLERLEKNHVKVKCPPFLIFIKLLERPLVQRFLLDYPSLLF